MWRAAACIRTLQRRSSDIRFSPGCDWDLSRGSLLHTAGTEKYAWLWPETKQAFSSLLNFCGKFLISFFQVSSPNVFESSKTTIGGFKKIIMVRENKSKRLKLPSYVFELFCSTSSQFRSNNLIKRWLVTKNIVIFSISQGSKTQRINYFS